MRTIRAALDEQTVSGGSLAVYRLADARKASDVGAELAARAANDRLPPAPILIRRNGMVAIGTFVDFGIIVIVAVVAVGVFFGIALIRMQRIAEPGIAHRPVGGTVGRLAIMPQAGAPRQGAAANRLAGTTPAEPVPVAGRAAGPAARAPIRAMAASTPVALRARSDTAMRAAASAPDGRVAGLVARGNAFFRAGDFASARLFYERAADAGDAQAALRAGATFDPTVLAGAGWRGMRGDPVQALRWYHRAAELGARNTESYVNRLQPK